MLILASEHSNMEMVQLIPEAHAINKHPIFC